MHSCIADEQRGPLNPPAVHALLELAPDGIFVADPGGCYTYVNAAGCAMLGYRREEILGRALSDFVSPDDVGRLMHPAAANASNGAQPGQWLLRRKDGSWLPVEINANVLPDGQWQGFVRDVSARKAQQAERNSLFAEIDRDRRWLGAVMNQMPLGVVLFDLDGHITFNERAEQMLGMELTPEGGGEQYAARIFHPDGSPVAASELPSMRVLRGSPAVYAQEYIVRRPDGSRTPVLASAAPILDGAGRLNGAVGVFQDTSERMGLERAVRENERLFKTVFELLPVGLWVADSKGNLVLGNAAGKRIWGGNPGVGPERYLHYQGWWVDSGRQIAADEWGIARALNRGETTRRELIRIRCFDGSFKTIINWAAPIRGEAGEITGAVAVNEDVTVLHQTQEQLRAAVRERENILAVVAHDLRTPLSGIALQALLLQRMAQALGGGAERMDAAARSIGEMTRAMSGLVDDLLAISTAGSGRSMINFEPVPAADVIAKAAEAARPLLAQARLQLEVAQPGELPPVHVDLNRVLRVFANLFDNALKFTEPDGRILVRADAAQGAVRFSVGNTGPALQEHERERLFQPFWQAGAAAARGAGLGLSICRSIVEAHGGSIWTEPAEGLRVKICFVLPCVRPAPADTFAPH